MCLWPFKLKRKVQHGTTDKPCLAWLMGMWLIQGLKSEIRHVEMHWIMNLNYSLDGSSHIRSQLPILKWSLRVQFLKNIYIYTKQSSQNPPQKRRMISLWLGRYCQDSLRWHSSKIPIWNYSPHRSLTWGSWTKQRLFTNSQSRGCFTCLPPWISFH